MLDTRCMDAGYLMLDNGLNVYEKEVEAQQLTSCGAGQMTPPGGGK